MNEVRAQLNDFRQSPRKMRGVANLLRGKKAVDALNALKFSGKRSGEPLSKLLKSAIANAKTQNLSEDSLRVKEIRVDGGATLYRRQPASRGRSSIIRKRTSHVNLVLVSQEDTKKKEKKTKEKK
jgi:large subunit ribosomal protein L22